jgi:RecA-family ATPase
MPGGFHELPDDDLGGPHIGNGGPGTAPRFTVKHFNKIRLTTTATYLIKGLLPRSGLAVIWGPPKCGKSFIAFDSAMHIALGREYRGRRVQQGTVVYCALEGGGGFAARVEAWRKRKLGDDQGGNIPFFLLDVALDLIADRDELVACIRAQVEQPNVVVIDTLNRALIGDENSSADMGKLVRAAGMISTAFDCLVVLIHHCGIAGNRLRGHSSLSGADDAQSPSTATRMG